MDPAADVSTIGAKHGAPKPTLKCGFKGSAAALSAHMLEAHSGKQINGKPPRTFTKKSLNKFQWKAKTHTKWNSTTRLDRELVWTSLVVDRHDEDLKVAMRMTVVPNIGFVFLPCLLHRAYEGTYKISITQQARHSPACREGGQGFD